MAFRKSDYCKDFVLGFVFSLATVNHGIFRDAFSSCCQNPYLFSKIFGVGRV